jgi:hypothetical protein
VVPRNQRGWPRAVRNGSRDRSARLSRARSPCRTAAGASQPKIQPEASADVARGLQHDLGRERGPERSREPGGRPLGSRSAPLVRGGPDGLFGAANNAAAGVELVLRRAMIAVCPRARSARGREPPVLLGLRASPVAPERPRSARGSGKPRSAGRLSKRRAQAGSFRNSLRSTAFLPNALRRKGLRRVSAVTPGAATGRPKCADLCRP